MSDRVSMRTNATGITENRSLGASASGVRAPCGDSQSFVYPEQSFSKTEKSELPFNTFVQNKAMSEAMNRASDLVEGYQELTASNLSRSVRDTRSRLSLVNEGDEDDAAESRTLSSIHYDNTIKRLQEYMPHLQNVGKPSKIHDRATVECYDYVDNTVASANTHSFPYELSRAKQEFQTAITDNIPNNVQLRLIMAEDLSSKMINILGSCFGMNPEFFEEHLLNSGWCTKDHENEDPSTWSTRDLHKDYKSIKWFRPIKRNVAQVTLPQGTWDLPEFPLSFSELPIRRKKKEPNGRIMVHILDPAVNIFRGQWKTELDSASFSAWEERASIWRTQIGSTNLVILLLDPLPIIRYRGVRDETSSSISVIPNVDGNGQPEVNSGPVPSIDGVNLDTTTPQCMDVNNDSMVSRAPADEERVSVQDPESGRTSIERDRDSIIRSAFAPFRFVNYQNFWKSRQKARHLKDSETDHEPRNPDTTSDCEDNATEYWRHCNFEGNGSRVLSTEYYRTAQPTQLPQFAIQVASTESTAKTLDRALRHDSYGPIRGVGPLNHLFMLILRDTSNNLQSMDFALTEIAFSMLDESHLHSQIDRWRQMLTRFEIELRNIELSLQQYTESTVIKDEDALFATKGGQGVRFTEDLFRHCATQVSNLRRRTKSSYKSLMTAMSLVESKRGIAEAESVTRLTELAFLFIPLTFSASLFSMQVKELDATKVSLYNFFIVAIVITTCSYVFRLLIRSRWLIKMRRVYTDSVRGTTGPPRGAPVPTTSYLVWVSMRSWLPLSIVLFPAAILAGLWTRPLQTDIKIGITTGFGILGLSCVFIIYLARITKKLSHRWIERLAQ